MNDPIIAGKLGIGMVHQHFTLIPTFTVVENIALTLSLTGRLNLKKIEEMTLSNRKIGLGGNGLGGHAYPARHPL
jgi:ABC-type uncharacterized transport system ATPase subunit